MDDNRIKVLRDLDTSKAIDKLALPAIVGFLVMAVYSMVDTLFISWWSYEGAGAIQVVLPILLIIGAIGLSFGIGGGSYISRLLGEGENEEAASVLATSLFTAIFFSFFFVGFSLYNLENIVIRFGAKGDIVKLAVKYGFYIVIGGLFVIPSMVFNNVLRSEGSAKLSMIGMAGGSIVNIFLDPLFIFTFNMGIEGAAIATMLSQFISLAILYSFYIRKKTMVRLDYRKFRLDFKIYKEVFKIGLPTFFRQVLFAISIALLNETAGLLGGEYLLSAMGVVGKITAIPAYYIFGMGQGVQPVVGYNYGAKNKERVMSAQKNGIRKAFIGAIFSVIFLLVFSDNIIGFFTKEEGVLEYAHILIIFSTLALLFFAVSNTIAVIFQAMGHGRASLFFSVLRQGVLLIPAIIILPKFFGVYGVIYTQFVVDVLTFIISLIVYIPFLIKINKEGII